MREYYEFWARVHYERGDFIKAEHFRALASFLALPRQPVAAVAERRVLRR